MESSIVLQQLTNEKTGAKIGMRLHPSGKPRMTMLRPTIDRRSINKERFR